MEQKERTYSTKELFRRFFPYYRPYGAVVAKDLACAALTTLAELMVRFFDVTEGEISVGGVNVKEGRCCAWRFST